MSTHTQPATQKWFCFKKTWPFSFTQLSPYCCSQPLTFKGPALPAWQLSMNTEKSRWALTWLLGNYHHFLYHNSCSSSIFCTDFASSHWQFTAHTPDVLFSFFIHTFEVSIQFLALNILCADHSQMMSVSPWTSDMYIRAYLISLF